MAVSPNLRALSYQAIEPDPLETVLAGQLSGRNAAFIPGFMYGAESRRNLRAGALAEQQQEVNSVLSQLAQREMSRQALGDQLTAATGLAQHGYSPLAMPLVREQLAPGANLDTSAIVGGSEAALRHGTLARVLQQAGAGAEHAAGAGWEVPLPDVTGIPMRRMIPPNVQAATARGAGGDEPRVTFEGGITGEPVIRAQGRNVERTRETFDTARGSTSEMRRELDNLRTIARNQGDRISERYDQSSQQTIVRIHPRQRGQRDRVFVIDRTGARTERNP